MFKNISRVSVLASLLLFVMTGCSYKKLVQIQQLVMKL